MTALHFPDFVTNHDLDIIGARVIDSARGRVARRIMMLITGYLGCVIFTWAANCVTFTIFVTSNRIKPLAALAPRLLKRFCEF